MNQIFKSIKRVNMYNQYIKYRIPITLKSDIYLIKWLPNSESKFHGHRGKKCNFVLIKGYFLEEIRKKNKNSVETKQIIYPFTKYSINDNIGIHKMINNENKIKWSIHYYY